MAETLTALKALFCMITSDIRAKFLTFFEKHGHAIIPSAPLIPENDPTTLFTGSGMQPMVPFLLGEAHPLGTRIADSQKCFRSQDIEEVGDNRHTTFFEMLGNWSLGDFFKKDQITWMFEFLIKEIGLNPKNLYVTVFRGSPDLNIPRDEEAVNLWKECFASVGIEAEDVDFAERDGMKNGRIFYYPEKKNWWSRSGVPGNMPVGEPGGPDTEMFWDSGAERKSHETSAWKDEPCHVNCDCGRFVEIGNNVFMQYVKKESGFELLPKANVDFGGGLERLAAASNGNPDVFLIDAFDGARSALEQAIGKKYGADETETYAFRIVLDHIRAATFLIGDHVLPSNKDQGYFVRRLIRRAVRFARTLGAGSVVRAAASAYIDSYKDAYPDLVAKRDFILTTIEAEERKFAKTIEQGLKEFEKAKWIGILDEELPAGVKSGSVKGHAEFVLPGEIAFDLFQTYGFPIELSEELAKERGITIDRQDFNRKMEKHREGSRAGSEQKFAGGLADTSAETTRLHTATHLLHQALRQVLGPHVAQKGSNINAERLRFDFSHHTKMTTEQIKQVEDLVNAAIKKDYPVGFELMDVDEAKKQGAIGLFEDTYAAIGSKIKVYTVGVPNGAWYSKEVCGGPHVTHTGELGSFKIQKEEASSAGVRRIKAIVTGKGDGDRFS